MSAYLARLKNINADNFTNTPNIEPAKPTQPTSATHFGGFDGFVGSPTGHVVSNDIYIEVIIYWWLLHFANRESEQMAIWPPSSHAEVMALNPNAISAMPIQSPLVQVMAIFTPQSLLDFMRIGGYSLSVDGNDLLVAQAQWIDTELATLITLHKAGLIKILQSEIES